MGNIVISTLGEQNNNDIKVSSYRLNIHNLRNNYLPQTIDQRINTHAKRIDF